MEMTLALVGAGGDARLSFTDNHIRLSWTETTARERKMISLLVKQARKAKFSVATVDQDGKPNMPARWRDLPGLFGKGKGEILLQGSKKNIQAIAQEMFNEELKSGSLVSVAQSDGTWKVVKPGDEEAKLKGDEKKEVTASKPVGGG